MSEIRSCPERRTLTAKQPSRMMASWLRDVVSMQIRTRGGSSDSDVNEETVIAWTLSRDPFVTTETPLAHSLRTSLYS
jgi:hypothetical protein